MHYSLHTIFLNLIYKFHSEQHQTPLQHPNMSSITPDLNVCINVYKSELTKYILDINWFNMYRHIYINWNKAFIFCFATNLSNSFNKEMYCRIPRVIDVPEMARIGGDFAALICISCEMSYITKFFDFTVNSTLQICTDMDMRIYFGIDVVTKVVAYVPRHTLSVSKVNWFLNNIDGIKCLYFEFMHGTTVLRKITFNEANQIVHENFTMPGITVNNDYIKKLHDNVSGSASFFDDFDLYFIKGIAFKRVEQDDSIYFGLIFQFEPSIYNALKLLDACLQNQCRHRFAWSSFHVRKLRYRHNFAYISTISDKTVIISPKKSSNSSTNVATVLNTSDMTRLIDLCICQTDIITPQVFQVLKVMRAILINDRKPIIIFCGQYFKYYTSPCQNSLTFKGIAELLSK